jgi:hypothetical protein
MFWRSSALKLPASLTWTGPPPLPGAAIHCFNEPLDAESGITAAAVREARPRSGRRREIAETQIRVRLDGGFSSPAILDYLDQEHVEYLVGFAGNPALEARVEPLMRAVRVLSATSGKTETLFADIKYQTKTWAKPRRLIVKAEVVRFPDRPARDNDRYVVTNLTLKPERVYKIYRGRGDMENRIKELHHDLEVDRTSCTDFKANQFRVLLTAAAYVLMQELRFRAAATEFATAQVGTLRLRLFKLGAWVERSIRRIVIHLPLSYPWARSWQAIASAVGATL